MPKYKRIMLKLSGEMLGGTAGAGLDKDAINTFAREMIEVAKSGVELAVVVGGGNILRGAHNSVGVERATGDYMGMLATVINAMAVQSAIEQLGHESRVLSAIEVRQACEFYIRRRAMRHLEKGRIIILSGGTGNPFFTTDTAAALRATELACDVLLKATNVDGVYSADPKKDPTATRYDQLSHQDCISRNLRVMDQAAFSLCQENRMPILVFSVKQPGNIVKAAAGENIGTLVG